MISRPHPENEHQLSINIFGFCILDTLTAMEGCYPIIIVLAPFIGKNARADIATTS